jgi:hypothetical protein
MSGTLQFRTMRMLPTLLVLSCGSVGTLIYTPSCVSGAACTLGT